MYLQVSICTQTLVHVRVTNQFLSLLLTVANESTKETATAQKKRTHVHVYTCTVSVCCIIAHIHVHQPKTLVVMFRYMYTVPVEVVQDSDKEVFIEFEGVRKLNCHLPHTVYKL